MQLTYQGGDFRDNLEAIKSKGGLGKEETMLDVNVGRGCSGRDPCDNF